MHKHRDKLPEFEEPKKKLITDHDQHVKELFQMQTNVSTNLKSELHKVKVFQKATEGFTLSNHIAGTSSLKQLQENENRQSEINELLSYGLTKDEIDLYYDYKSMGLEGVQKKYLNHEPDVLKNKIDIILKTIKSSLDKGETVCYSTQPMDSIKEMDSIYKEATNQLTPDINKIRRKARKVANRLRKDDVTTVPVTTVTPTLNCDSKTLWDKTEIPENKTSRKQTVQYTCKNQNFYTIKDGEIIKIDNQPNKTKVPQVTGQLSLEEIKQLPQFTNYQPGKPSNVIYVKNLPKKTSIEDLKRYFKDCPAQEYKVMSGKMRGQAFLTFDSVETAQKMLNTLNGLIINDKPVILQYGRTLENNTR
ncbi:RNA-binding protein 41-like [Atheta coriaria]|uniref:RNA-binding protein 41-like n=1 Tax=Dalotia coriaria TaxID=877792 RepID=UPI0031F3F8C4